MVLPYSTMGKVSLGSLSVSTKINNTALGGGTNRPGDLNGLQSPQLLGTDLGSPRVAMQVTPLGGFFLQSCANQIPH